MEQCFGDENTNNDKGPHEEHVLILTLNNIIIDHHSHQFWPDGSQKRQYKRTENRNKE